MPRRHQLAGALGIEMPPAVEADRRPWHAVVMSRLGRNRLARRLELATLYRWIERSSDCGEAALAVPGTAAHPWVSRACELLGTAPVQVRLANDPAVQESDCPAAQALKASSAAITRDHVAILLADRVDVAFVRPGGTTYKLLLQRLCEDRSGSVRVLVPVASWGQAATAPSQRVIDQLLAAGAIGYCCRWKATPAVPQVTQDVTDSPQCSAALESLIQQPQRWLIHWTRGRGGAWPGQSEQQFHDWLLLSCPQPADLTPLATLKRIVTQRQLVGTARTIAGPQPVVCFTSLSLMDVVQRRVFRPHLGRWDAEPYGLAIDREVAMRLGAQPVVYMDSRATAESSTAAPEQPWRLQARGKTYDWTAEQEWRLPGIADLRDVGPRDAVVFVSRDEEMAELRDVPWPVTSIQSLQRIIR